MKQRLLLLVITALAVFGTSARVSAQVIDTQYLTATSIDCATAGSCATFDPGSSPSVTYVVSGTFTATLSFEATADGANWTTVNVINVSTSANGTSASGTGTYSFANSGFIKVRVRCSAYTSGTAKVVATRGWATARLFTSLAGDGTASAPSYSFASDPDTGLFWSASNKVNLAIDGLVYYLFKTSEFVVGTNSGLSLTGGGTINLGTGGSTDTLVQRTAVGQVAVGTSTVQPIINGTLTTSTTSVCTIADTNETDLWTYSLPAGALNADGRGVRITTWGTYANNANVKTVRLYVGATAIFSNATPTSAAGTWVGDAVVIRTGATSQTYRRLFQATGATAGWDSATLAETMANALTIKISGQNGTASAGDVCVKGAFVETIK
jgi:hypothetical protein